MSDVQGPLDGEAPSGPGIGLVLAALLLAWLASALHGGDDAARRAAEAAGSVAPEVWAGAWWRLLSALLLLSDFFELLLLGIVLCLAGRWLEERLGPIRVVVVFVVAGLAGQLAGMALDASPFLGAPEGIAGILGAALALLLSPQARRDGSHHAALAAAAFGLMLIGATYGTIAVSVAVASGALLTLVMGSRGAPAGFAQAALALVLTALAAVGAALALAPDPARMAEYELQRGAEAWRAGDTASAVRRWERATVLDPGLGAAWFDLSVAYARLGLVGPSAAALDEARRLAPAMPELVARLGELEGAAGHASRAEQMYRILLRLQPDRTDATLALAAALSAQGSRHAAAALYDSLCDRHPLDPEVLSGAAAWYDDDGADTPRAQSLWRRLAGLPPRDPDDALRVARAQLVSGDPRAAEATATRFLPSGDAPATATLRARLLTLRANARAELGRFEEALGDAAEAASIGRPDWATAYIRARLAFWWARDVAAGRATGRPPPAAPLWEEASRLASSDFERDLTQGWASLAVAHDALAAEAGARRVLERRPRDAEARYLLGLSLRARGQAPAAGAALREASALQPGDRELREATATP